MPMRMFTCVYTVCACPSAYLSVQRFQLLNHTNANVKNFNEYFLRI